MEAPQSPPSNDDPPCAKGAAAAHWRASRRLTAGLLVVWFVATFVMAFFARDLDFRLFGWPFSFFMAAQGSLLVYLVIVAIYSRAMDRFDERFGIDGGA